MTKEEKLNKANDFNKSWEKLCRGQYRNGGWDIKKRGKLYWVMRENGLARLPENFGYMKKFKTLQEAKTQVNQYVFENEMYVSTEKE